MLTASLVTDIEELVQIHKLNQQNLKINLSIDERKEEGFVTWLYSLDLLKKMHKLAPSVIVKDNNRVIGYALTTPKEASKFHPDLMEMMENIQLLQYREKLLSSHSFYCMGQICIDKNYRGKGVFDQLYQKHKTFYMDRYNLIITEISTSNIRSQRAHEKVGFKTIHTHNNALDEWNIVVWDWENV